MQSGKKGFTLIELLVVISVISLLSSIVFASLNNARVKARNAKRIQDINQLVNAFNLGYTSGSPINGGDWETVCIAQVECIYQLIYILDSFSIPGLNSRVV